MLNAVNTKKEGNSPTIEDSNWLDKLPIRHTDRLWVCSSDLRCFLI